MPNPPERKPSPMSGYSQAMGLSAELVATTAVGVGLGWLADKGLNTSPLFIFIGALVGGAAGISRIFRTWSKK